MVKRKKAPLDRRQSDRDMRMPSPRAPPSVRWCSTEVVAARGAAGAREGHLLVDQTPRGCRLPRLHRPV
jgi:hypothetical protein